MTPVAVLNSASRFPIGEAEPCGVGKTGLQETGGPKAPRTARH